MRDDVLQRWASDRAEELPGAHVEYPFGPDFEVYRVRDLMFMAHTVRTGAPIVILKARPADAEVLREAFAEITPGYHMNKKHWITLNPGGRLERQLVEDLVTESYLLVVEKLPRAQRPVDPATFGQRPA
ncbi:MULTISPECIES: MmcQ/YjbR family DNA-binding protein [unclassified Leucobacter]|uniref:MmcQ/YjbR family DNA-binding protein n=1 Tax=unclassified Leucobacter TaxID=2621730 RepID=UPI00062224F2|nr:MmcQ/YjbR family DNA-binding protein [Leucobacter sp. Ag1]KKI21424.1 cytoplasmic protein [Leucobacter sp. Ag1]